MAQLLIGTAPNQIPLNSMLGTLAFQNKEGVAVDLLSIGRGNIFSTPSDNTIALTIAGTEAWRTTATGKFYLGKTAGVSGETFSSAGYAMIGSSAVVGIGDGEDGTGFVGTYTNSDLVVRTNNTERVRISGSSNTVTVAGSVVMSGGSAAAPSIAFSGDTDTGLFSAGAGYLGLVTNGVERLRITPNGRLDISPSSTVSENYIVNIGVGTTTTHASAAAVQAIQAFNPQIQPSAAFTTYYGGITYPKFTN